MRANVAQVVAQFQQKSFRDLGGQEMRIDGASGEGGVGSGEWGVGSGEWGVGSGEWGVGREWGVGSGEWGVGSGEWGRENHLCADGRR